MVTPVNTSLAVNYGCRDCRTTAIAFQLVASLTALPDPDTMAQLNEIWRELDQLAGEIPDLTDQEIVDRLKALETRILLTLDRAGSAINESVEAAGAPAGSPPVGASPSPAPEEPSGENPDTDGPQDSDATDPTGSSSGSGTAGSGSTAPAPTSQPTPGPSVSPGTATGGTASPSRPRGGRHRDRRVLGHGLRPNAISVRRSGADRHITDNRSMATDVARPLLAA